MTSPNGTALSAEVHALRFLGHAHLIGTHRVLDTVRHASFAMRAGIRIPAAMAVQRWTGCELDDDQLASRGRHWALDRRRSGGPAARRHTYGWARTACTAFHSRRLADAPMPPPPPGPGEAGR